MNTSPAAHVGRSRLLPAVLAVLLTLLRFPHGGLGDDAAPSSQTGDQAAVRRTERPLIVPLLSPAALQTDEWVFVSRDKDSRLSQTWQIVPAEGDPVLVCKGSPYGYLRTKHEYADFEMQLEWRFPSDENGNSGILLYTAEEDKVWPKAIQVQLHQPVAGSIFPSGNARSDNEIRDVRDLARPVNQWNVCHISSAGGTISVVLNGKQVGEVTGCRPSKGCIGFQSEGSEVHFRRITIRERQPPAPPIGQSHSSLPRIDVNEACSGVMSCSLWTESVVCQCPAPSACVFSQRRNSRRQKETPSHVVYRNSLAPAGHPRGDGDRLRRDVDPAACVVVAGRHDRVRGSRRRRPPF